VRAAGALEGGKPPAAPAATTSAGAAATSPAATGRPSLAFSAPPTSREPAPVPMHLGSSPSRPWMRPTAIGSGVAAVALAALAVQQGLSASSASSDAEAMLDGGVFRPGADQARYRELRGDADAARRNAYVSAGFAAAFATAAGVLGWMSWDRSPDPEAVAFRF
jgi:hypothetical protein